MKPFPDRKAFARSLSHTLYLCEDIMCEDFSNFTLVPYDKILLSHIRITWPSYNKNI